MERSEGASIHYITSTAGLKQLSFQSMQKTALHSTEDRPPASQAARDLCNFYYFTAGACSVAIRWSKGAVGNQYYQDP